jgi:hypothetical protein
MGDLLLRCLPWGLNFALWGCLLAAAVIVPRRPERQVFAGGGAWLALPIVLSPLAFLWHASPALKWLNGLALLTALSLILLRAYGGRLTTASLAQYALGSLLAAFNAAFGAFFLLFGNREWRKAPDAKPVRTVVAIAGGIALAIPPLLLFGGLLMGADAVFSRLAIRFLRSVPGHVAMFVFVAYGAGGYLRGLFLSRDLNLNASARKLPLALGTVQIVVILGALDLLFLAFVAVQVRYFFGGSALVRSITELTYSEYARRGFFQLVTVAALVLPFLLFLHWWLRPEDAAAQRWFRWLAAGQVALLFVIIASAFQRMRLYEAEYGLSEQRLYPTAFMGWLGVVLLWFCLTVLRGHRERFAFGAMVAGFLLIAALHLVNPDALIARTNLARARAGHNFDASYVAGLSNDAVPEIVSGLAGLKAADRCALATDLLLRWPASENADWRVWSVSRFRARQAVSAAVTTLRAGCSDGKYPPAQSHRR